MRKVEEGMREKILKRLDWVRRRNPTGYAQLTVAVHPNPPAYAMDDPKSEWWTSQEAKDFYDSLTMDETRAAVALVDRLLEGVDPEAEPEFLPPDEVAWIVSELTPASTG
jgi:hypothetical protein